jgi:hypothetical protein
MPAGLIEQQHGVATRFDRLGDLRQMQRIAAVLQRGSTRPAAVPRAGQLAPKM